MADIYVTKKNDVYNVIEADEGILREISDCFSFEVEGREFMPSYKNKRWDGILRLFNRKNQTLYAGLLPHLCLFAQREGYDVDVSDSVDMPSEKPSESMVIKYMTEKLNIHSDGKKISPRPPQIAAFRHAVCSNRCVIEAATASGKSLIIYSLIRFYSQIVESKRKTLIIVPSINLVNQMYNDFDDYASEDSWNAEDNCHRVFEGQDKLDPDKEVVISTYQSIYKLGKEYFDNFDVVICDETHIAKAATIKGILQKLVNCPYRFGFTGTLQDSECHRWVIEGLFGMAKEVVSAKQMIDAGDAPPLRIECIAFQYNSDINKHVSEMTYHEEKQFIVGIESRNQFICDLANDIKGNTLILFELVKLHGKPLYEKLKSESDKNVYMVCGDTDGDMREEIRNIMETEDDAIIVASYGVFSTGVSIKKLHNMIFAGSPGKKKQRVVQSIGRQLRQHETKQEAVLYDLTDDMSYNGRKNFNLKHFMERVKIYINEGHPYRITTIKL